MISKDDCMAMCGLSAEEVAAVAEHEHIPEIAACALSDYLLHGAHGAERIRDMIVEDIRRAVHGGDVAHARELVMALRHFLSEHPDARAGLARH